jgi:hypothetical protein
MNNKIRQFSTVLLLILISSCATKKHTYHAINSKRNITVENDSILKYTELIRCFGNSNTLKYKKENGLIKVFGVTDTKQKGIFSLAQDLYGSELIIEKDSLLIKETGEIFYKDRFLKSKANQNFKEFYIILNNKAKKVKKSNFKRILINRDWENYTSLEIDKDDAKREYGIDKKYSTIKLIRK